MAMDLGLQNILSGEPNGVSINFQNKQIALVMFKKNWNWKQGEVFRGELMVDGMKIDVNQFISEHGGAYIAAVIPKSNFQAILNGSSIELKLASILDRKFDFDVSGLKAASAHLDNCMKRHSYVTE